MPGKGWVAPPPGLKGGKGGKGGKGACYNCGGAHLARDCPNPKYCNNCWETGHMAAQLPKGKGKSLNDMQAVDNRWGQDSQWG